MNKKVCLCLGATLVALHVSSSLMAGSNEHTGPVLELRLRNTLPPTSAKLPLTDYRMTESTDIEYHVDNRGLVSMTDGAGEDRGIFIDGRDDPYFLDRIRFFSLRIDPLDSSIAYLLASTWIDNTTATPVYPSSEPEENIDSHMVLLAYELDGETGAAVTESRREVVRFEQRLNVGHTGGGMVFSANGQSIFFTIGDHQNSRGTGVPGSQDTFSSDGALVSLNPRPDGARTFSFTHSAYAPDNPIFAKGLRNAQSLERIGQTLYFSNIGKTAAETMHIVCTGCNFGWGDFIEGTFELDSTGNVIRTLTAEQLVDEGFQVPFSQIDRRGIGGFAVSNMICGTTTLPNGCFTADLISGQLFLMLYDDPGTDRLLTATAVRLVNSAGARLSSLNDLAPVPPARVDARPGRTADGTLAITLEVSGETYIASVIDTILLADSFEL